MSKSLQLLRELNDNVLHGQTFHHHYHILYDLGDELNRPFNYLEIGAYAGGSACLMALHTNCKNIISIDLGQPIDPVVAIKNVRSCNTDIQYNYLQGNSQSYEMYEQVCELITSVDILFIDGDHSFQGVINDFLLYEKLVPIGGYIVFDDYLDHIYSPDVRYAVDSIVEQYGDNFNIIGTRPNTASARPESLTLSNEFILQRKSN
jgi:cephalosporin hydroxylase